MFDACSQQLNVLLSSHKIIFLVINCFSCNLRKYQSPFSHQLFTHILDIIRNRINCLVKARDINHIRSKWKNFSLWTIYYSFSTVTVRFFLLVIWNYGPNSPFSAVIWFFIERAYGKRIMYRNWNVFEVQSEEASAKVICLFEPQCVVKEFIWEAQFKFSLFFVLRYRTLLAN